MTQPYWQRYLQQISNDLEGTQDRFWKKVRDDINRKRQPKHYLQLYSMCKTDNPYIRQIKSNPNITSNTVAEMVCRDKACEMQYCLSLQVKSIENRHRLIDLKGCKEQYETFKNCMTVEMGRIEKLELKLRNQVHGKVPVTVEIKELEKPNVVLQEEYI